MDEASAVPDYPDRGGSLEQFPISSGGLYTLADILTSIGKKQSKMTPTVIKKRMQDDPNSVEWKEYQAKRLQALKILKQEKELRMREEMRRLGLKTVTPELRSRLEAQFQYLHEALLPDSGLEADQEAAAKALKSKSKRKSKKSASVHWSHDVLEKERTKSKSKTTISSKSTTSTSKARSKKISKTNLEMKSDMTISINGTTSSKHSKPSVSSKSSKPKTPQRRSVSAGAPVVELRKAKSKSKKTEKLKQEKSKEVEPFDLERLEKIEVGAIRLLEDLNEQFGALDKPLKAPDNIKDKSRNNPLKNGVFTDLELDKIKLKLSSTPKLKLPGPITNKPSVIPKKPRSSSLGRLRGSKAKIQSSGYGPHFGLKRTDNSKGTSGNFGKKTHGKTAADTKNTGIFKKAAAQQNAISGMREIMNMKIPKKVVRSKSEVGNLNTPKLKAVPIIGSKMVTLTTKPVNAGKSKSTANARSLATKPPFGGTTNANLNKGKPPMIPLHLPTIPKTRTEFIAGLKATKSKSLDASSPVPKPKTTVIAELYSVNSQIAAGVDGFTEKAIKKNVIDLKSKPSNVEKIEQGENSQHKGQQSGLYVRPAQRKPPKFPTVDLCNVFPGTQEWDTYWEKFNGQISNYYSEMDEYLKSMNDFTVDLEDYSKELKKIQIGNQAFAMKLGLNPNYKSTPSIAPKLPPSMQFANTPLEPGIYNINGYIIKSGGGRIPGLRLTTVGDDGFSLELDLAEIDIDPQLITVETEFNVMTITVPVKTEMGRVRIIQIRVPGRSNVNDLSLREVQRNTKKGLKSRVLLITGN